MIQRIQTVFLLIAVALLVATNFFSLASFQLQSGEIIDASVAAVCNGGPFKSMGIATSVMSLLAAVICSVTVFLYKNRKVQVRLAYAALIITLLLTGYFVGYVIGLNFADSQMAIAGVSAMVLPPIALVFILLAIKKINADENLVRSLDRIR